ncbi:MAG: leucine-rich repeat protein [Oscillospiraceae bacterium]|nr:leucine-rich repeat protein [Oscillospiraceae bacterium]
MKKIILWAVSAALTVCVIAAFTVNGFAVAQDTKVYVTKDGNYQYSYLLDDDASPVGAVVVRYNGNEKEVRVPNFLGGQKVVAIGDNAFDFKIYIEGIILPTSVTYVGLYAFADCYSLEYIYLPGACVDFGGNNLNYTVNADLSKCENLTIIGDYYGTEDEPVAAEVLAQDLNLEYVALGDVSMDGEIGADDARLVLRHVAKLDELSPMQQVIADVDRGGEIDSADARGILRKVAKLDPEWIFAEIGDYAGAPVEDETVPAAG